MSSPLRTTGTDLISGTAGVLFDVDYYLARFHICRAVNWNVASEVGDIWLNDPSPLGVPAMCRQLQCFPSKLGDRIAGAYKGGLVSIEVPCSQGNFPPLAQFARVRNATLRTESQHGPGPESQRLP